MNFLFFISLFAVSVLSNPLAPLMADPKAFVASLQNADPEVIQKMLDLVAKLVQDGIDDEASATADAEAKRAVSNTKSGELAVAEAALSKAQGELEAATGLMNELTGGEAIQKAALDKATADRDASQADFDKKDGIRADVTSRVAHENEEFATVLELLDSIVVPEAEFIGRSLLSSNLADPDAIEKVKAEVQALIDNANAEAASATGTAEDAAAKLVVDNAAHQDALDAHTDTAGQLQTAIIDVAGHTATRNTAQVSRDAASRNAFAAGVDADDAEAFQASEESRVASEGTTLAEVHDLLSGLLPAEF